MTDSHRVNHVRARAKANPPHFTIHAPQESKAAARARKAALGPFVPHKVKVNK